MHDDRRNVLIREFAEIHVGISGNSARPSEVRLTTLGVVHVLAEVSVEKNRNKPVKGIAA